MLFGTVSASAASAKPETPVLSGTAAGNRVTLNWNKVKKASGYQIFLYYKAYGKYKCVGRIKNRNITSFTLTGSEDKLYTYKIRSYLKQGNKTLYSPSSKALEIKTAPGKPVITRIRVREESGTPLHARFAIGARNVPVAKYVSTDYVVRYLVAATS